jgi:hypothetical protein
MSVATPVSAQPYKRAFPTALEARRWLEGEGFVFVPDDNCWYHPDREGNAVLNGHGKTYRVTVYAQLDPAAEAHQQTPTSIGEPDYERMTADALRQLIDYGNTRTVRKGAAKELGRRDREYQQPQPVDALLEPIAAEHCLVDSLTRSNGDFKEVSILGLRDALRAAYEAGLASTRKRK